ncbi:MAG: UDP-N-acetylglucosamine 1-carboxyvinyltransferase [Chloroflexota bacterium]|nr:MAG: UDP-N-acetylglucosamine 1-carboxyvinyltransferase [Chloroflexota bacterium]
MSSKDKILVKGQLPLHGDLCVDGNKNAALPLIAASVLCEGKVVLKRIPLIGDVKTLCEILVDMKADISTSEPETIIIDSSNLDPTRLNSNAWEEIRAAVLLVGPILNRFGKFEFPAPGGDGVGRRRLDSHLLAFKEMGATIWVNEKGLFVVEAPPTGLRLSDVWLDETSVTATENILTTAASLPGTTVLYNAACEPHVQDLANFLVQCGAMIEGIGTNRLTIHGTRQLKSVKEFHIGPDFVQTGAFIGIGLCTGSELRIRNAGIQHMRPIQIGLAKFGAAIQIQGDDIIVPAKQDLRIVEDTRQAIAKLDTHPWPGFPSDMSSTAVVLATQTEGAILIHEKMYESRLFFIDKLVRMGARISLCDPHRAIVVGKTQLLGAKLESLDIRAGIALITAGLCAKGETTIANAKQVDRGFYRIEERLRNIGAYVERI